jgi:hypothetical protein
VTINAPAHLQLLDGHPILVEPGIVDEVDLVHLLHGSMARLAFQTGRDVPVMAELDMLGKTVDLLPQHRFLLFPVLLEDLDALDLVIRRRELGMAAHAEFD